MPSRAPETACCKRYFCQFSESPLIDAPIMRSINRYPCANRHASAPAVNRVKPTHADPSTHLVMAGIEDSHTVMRVSTDACVFNGSGFDIKCRSRACGSAQDHFAQSPHSHLGRHILRQRLLQYHDNSCSSVLSAHRRTALSVQAWAWTCSPPVSDTSRQSDSAATAGNISFLRKECALSCNARLWERRYARGMLFI